MNESDVCFKPPSPILRFQVYFVGVFGTSLAVLGCAQNFLLLFIFIRRKLYRKSNYFYLTILSALDIVHCINYLAAMSTAVLTEYFDSLIWLNLIWHHYLIPVVVLDHTVLLASAYLLVAASFERYLAGKWDRYHCNLMKRSLLISGVFTLAIAINFSMYWEMELVHLPQCQGRAQYKLKEGKILHNEAYALYYTLWVRSIISVFLPFLLLTCLNFAILMSFTKSKWNCKDAPDVKNRRMISFKFRKLLHDSQGSEFATNSCGDFTETKEYSSCEIGNASLYRQSDVNTSLHLRNGIKLSKNYSACSSTVQTHLDTKDSPPPKSLRERDKIKEGSPFRSSCQSLNRRAAQDVRIGNTDVCSGTSKWVKKARNRVKRSAAKSLIAIVAEYMISNGFSVVLAAWERMDIESLISYETFYAISSDSISLLTVISTVLRLYIYWATDIGLRRQITRILCGLPKSSSRSAKNINGTCEMSASTPPRGFTDVVSLAVMKSRKSRSAEGDVNGISQPDITQGLTPSSLAENVPHPNLAFLTDTHEAEAAKYANLRKFMQKKGML